MIRPRAALLSTLLSALLSTLLCASLAAAEPPADIDTDGFRRDTADALALRAQRTLDSDAFLALMARDDVVLLDTRSQQAYAMSHLKGAVHLNFSDFTAEKLAKLIPSPDTPILIYCNNNLRGGIAEMAYPRKSATMALNIPTFVNLVGYGYRNVYELGALVAIEDPRFVFEGTLHDRPQRKRR